MAALGSQSIASSYEQLLHVDADGGGNSTTHVSVKDGDNGTTFGFTIASDALMMSSTNRLEFGDTGTYIHQSADGVLDLVSDTEIEINATTIDMNGAADLSGNLTVGGDIDLEGDIDVNGTANLDNTDIDGTFTQDAGAVVFNEAGADYDFRVEGSGEANALFVQGSDGAVGIGTDSPTQPLHIAHSTDAQIQLERVDISVAEDDTIGAILIRGGESSQTDVARIRINADADWTDSSSPTKMTFETTPSGATADAPRMIIDSAGDVTFTGDLIMADGKGIDFAADASPAAGMTAEILDDYEEGTWTGVITDGTNPMTMSYTTGYYTKVGNLVHVSGLFSTSSLGSASGDIRMTGLPFTAANNTAAYSGGGAYGHNYDIDPIYPVSYYGKINDTYIYLRVWDVTTGTSAMQASEWTANGQIILGFSYRAA